MQNVIIKRYKDPQAVGGWEGWIEPEDKSWILFIKTNGEPPVFYPLRDVDGGIIEPETLTEA